MFRGLRGAAKAARGYLQVAWQMLREDVDAPGDTLVNQPPAVGAVLTSQRLLIVSPQLRVLVAGPPVPGITSCLWLGPALLYATSDHQVRSLIVSHIHILHSLASRSNTEVLT